MSAKKIIYVMLLLSALIVGGYANNLIYVKEDAQFEIVFQKPIESIFENDLWWGRKESFFDRVWTKFQWSQLSEDEKKAESEQHIKKLVQNLKICLNGKDLEWAINKNNPFDPVITCSIKGYQCVVRAVSVDLQRVFDITLKRWDNGIKIIDVEEIPKAAL